MTSAHRGLWSGSIERLMFYTSKSPPLPFLHLKYGFVSVSSNLLQVVHKWQLASYCLKATSSMAPRCIDFQLVVLHFTKHWMSCLHSTWRMTASLSLRAADDDIDHLTRKVPRTRTSLGDRSFTVTGPRLWNNLPLHLRDSELALLEFHRLLMTHLTTATSDCCCF